MAFPTIADTNNNGTASGTSHTVNLPPNIVAGDLLIIFALTGTATLTFPSGWNQIDLNTSTFHSEVQYKIADGSEGASITVTSSASVAGGWIAYRINNWHGTTPPESPAMTTGANANSDPPAVTPSWGSADNLYIAGSWQGSSDNPTSFPTGYTLSQTTFAGTANLSVAGKQATSASDNPSAFVYAGTRVWRAATIAVRPGDSSPITNEPDVQRIPPARNRYDWQQFSLPILPPIPISAFFTQVMPDRAQPVRRLPSTHLFFKIPTEARTSVWRTAIPDKALPVQPPRKDYIDFQIPTEARTPILRTSMPDKAQIAPRGKDYQDFLIPTEDRTPINRSSQPDRALRPVVLQTYIQFQIPPTAGTPVFPLLDVLQPARPAAQTKGWIQFQIPTEDRTPVSRSSMPDRALPRPPNSRDWVQSAVQLTPTIGQPIFSSITANLQVQPNRKDWVNFSLPIPPPPQPPPFTPVLAQPARARVPQQPVTSQNLLPGLLTRRPFIPIAWTNPRAAQRAAQGFIGQNLLETMLGAIKPPFQAVEWRVPAPPRQPDKTWIVNLLLTTLAPQPEPPPAESPPGGEDLKEARRAKARIAAYNKARQRQEAEWRAQKEREEREFLAQRYAEQGLNPETMFGIDRAEMANDEDEETIAFLLLHS